MPQGVRQLGLENQGHESDKQKGYQVPRGIFQRKKETKGTSFVKSQPPVQPSVLHTILFMFKHVVHDSDTPYKNVNFLSTLFPCENIPIPEADHYCHVLFSHRSGSSHCTHPVDRNLCSPLNVHRSFLPSLAWLPLRWWGGGGRIKTWHTFLTAVTIGL